MEQVLVERVLVELLKMQRELDNQILGAKKLEYSKDKVALALIAEIGEMLNERPSLFKYWKENKSDNEQKFLIELVDVLHFVLSLTTQVSNDDEWLARYTMMIKPSGYTIGVKKALSALIQWGCNPVEPIGLVHFFALVDVLGVNMMEVVEAYMTKHQINYERLGGGY